MHWAKWAIEFGKHDYDEIDHNFNFRKTIDRLKALNVSVAKQIAGLANVAGGSGNGAWDDWAMKIYMPKWGHSYKPQFKAQISIPEAKTYHTIAWHFGLDVELMLNQNYILFYNNLLMALGIPMIGY